MLGEREPETYGLTRLADVEAQYIERADALGFQFAIAGTVAS
jgi:3-dehydroquinate dehydratase